MIQTFTPNDVIRYVYEETTEDENSLIEEAMISDQDLLEFYLDAIELKSLLNRVEYVPSNRLISSILAYSQNYNRGSQPYA